MEKPKPRPLWQAAFCKDPNAVFEEPFSERENRKNNWQEKRARIKKAMKRKLK